MEKQKFHLCPSTLILLPAGAIYLLCQLIVHASGAAGQRATHVERVSLVSSASSGEEAKRRS
ncbi:hypothetical protein [Candidatus Methylomirabilis sp.]|uniref:hypothetical protein n=1 Tax=Candidatus Methylomirabilis sp. TaxID=2032687 RepID=UPI003C76847F